MNECSTSWSQQCSSIIKYFPVLLLLLLGIGMGTGEIYHSDQFGYTVMAPAVVASNQPYIVAMSIFNCAQLSIYHVRLRGPNTNLSIQFTLTPYFPTTLYAFKVPSLNLGTYWLEVTTEKGCYVKNSTTLESSNFDNFIKVHTPKVLYHPGQLLQFRVFFHDYNMLPVTPAANTVIWIEDAKGYHVKGFRQLTINNGIFEGELRLSAHVNFGRWRICGRSAPHVIEQCSYIHVAKYELSKMNMHLKAPSEVYLVNGSFEVTVNAVHVIDGPVNGEVTLDIALYTGNLTAEPVQQVKIKSQIVNGDGKIKIDLKQFEKNLSKLKEGILQLTANIFERVIQQDQKVTRMVTIRTYTPITSQIFSEPIKDKYILDVGNELQSNTSSVGMIVQNGRVLDSIKLNPYKRGCYRMEVKMTPQLWPVFHVILLTFFTEKPTLCKIYSSIVDLRLSHHDGVFIDLPTQLSPGIEIMFNVKSIPDSYIGLTILDDRVFAFGENMDNDFRADYYDFIKAPMMSNDIIQTDKHTIVQPGLILLSNADEFKSTKLVVRRIKQVEPFNSTTIKGSIFNKLTNLYKKPVTSYYKCCDVPTTYREYNDVWLYDSIHHTQTEWSSWHAVVPEALINWRISAFSVHPLTGLSFLAPKPFKYVLAASELYYSLQLPYSIHPEEKLEISLVVSSWFNAKLKVEIRLMESIRFQVVGENKTDLSHKEVIIAPNSTVSVKYYIQALMVGKCQLRFTIISEAGVYDVTREVFVLEDINLRSQQFFKHQILTLRQPIAKGSLKLHHLPTSSGVQCYVSGDLVVPKMQNIKLIASTDNAEQMISKLLSIYLLYDYIKDFTWCSPNFKKFLMEELSAGFQSMMRLRMYDGGYRLYAENEKTSCSSTWLTAYAVLLLHRLEKFPSIIYEDRLIKKSEKFVMHNRGRYREFKDSCYVPGRRNLSAVELNIEIIKTLEASKRLISLKQPHAYVTYAMDQKYNYYMEAKRGLKPVKWKLPEEKSSWIYYRRELETAGRILSRQVTLGNIEQQAEIFEWLTYNLLGPVSTIHCYECYIAEQAYYDYLKTRTNLESNIKLKIWMNSKITNYTVFINNTNEWQEQYMELQPLNSTIDFEAEGTGDLVIRCNYKYVGGHSNIKLYHGYLSFTNATQIKFCVQRFKRDRKEYMGTNINIRLPSGYKLEDGSVALLMDKRLIIQASSVKRRSVLSLIMDPIPAAKLFCYSFNTIRFTTVTNLRNGTMSVYDFNNSDNPQIFSFNIFENTA